MKDAFGVGIQVGDHVTYGSRRGSSLYMSVGFVRAVAEQYVKVEVVLSTSYQKLPRTVTIRTPGNIVVYQP